ncbi:hypothetical protein [Paenarthrobacter ureafaciens]|nr:hypothetical protein [Paenarthrobacter ureafaciens]UOD83490.1 hypothetical protein MQZ73_20880 [Paenarthrobacter ureafaciens]
MIRKCIALVIPARLSDGVTANPQDVRHGTLEALYGQGNYFEKQASTCPR